MLRIRQFQMMAILFFSYISIVCVPVVDAHHGGVSAAFGPGAPVETASPMTLGKESFLLYERMEYVPFRNRDNAEPENVDTFTFFNTLVGFGFTDALSLYLTLPAAIKEQDNLGKSKGFGDLEFMAQYGFKYGERDGIRGFYRNGPDDTEGAHYTMDDLKMSLTGGISIPTGTISNRDDKGNIFDMGMQPGFGAPSFTFGFAASKLMFPHFTLTADTSFKAFSQQNDSKPGNEIRFNVAGGYEIFEDQNSIISRADVITEANVLHLTKDQGADRDPDNDTGGTILYFSPGFRASLGSHISIGALIKFPVWQDLNNESVQQGAEGLEDYRAVVTLTVSF